MNGSVGCPLSAQPTCAGWRTPALRFGDPHLTCDTTGAWEADGFADLARTGKLSAH